MQPLLFLLAFLMPPEPGTGIITGGHEAKPHSRPYMALIHYLVEETPNRCGGVLVRKDFVLTAAHCWGSSVNVVALGVHNIQQQESTWQVIPVKEAIHHPDYNPQNFSNDIMLIKLERKAMQTAAVRTLSLPWGKAQVKPREVCSVAGWGQDSMGISANILQEVELTVEKDEECESIFPDHYNQTTHICVGDPKMMKNILKGDSGGPLVCENVAHGIASYGQNNGTPPTVFMKVSHYMPWIKRTMKLFP
ncbi:granzyme H [Equus caballus]|uniref:Peptidase S1 domain-containing protein n=1 Tax=Equus caballus TaxID=9796 RepID=A0A9L0SZK2_HORSE|nr:granzyme H [Equus caballus]